MKENLTLSELLTKLNEFQSSFQLTHNNKPTLMSKEEGLLRAKLIAAELIEALRATNEWETFEDSFNELIRYMNEEFKKEKESKSEEDVMLEHQVDSFLDVLYLTFGAFSILGYDPTHSIQVVHHANMMKLGPDGKIIRDEHGKIRKPDNWQELYAPEPQIKKDIEKQLKDSSE